ncbi:MAG: hypothetical protein KatS3mg057_1873 [Herpetosiphonaceae bacterium]|nr:MAG: hypothetical protein KatS3mg057_1873 [Herpetosiphonaceae bacterium]
MTQNTEAAAPRPCHVCGEMADWVGLAEEMTGDDGSIVPPANWYQCPEGHVFSEPVTT